MQNDGTAHPVETYVSRSRGLCVEQTQAGTISLGLSCSSPALEEGICDESRHAMPMRGKSTANTVTTLLGPSAGELGEGGGDLLGRNFLAGLFLVLVDHLVLRADD